MMSQLLNTFADIDAARARLEAGQAPLSAEEVRRMVEGESPIRVFRQNRGLTQVELSKAAGVRQSAVSQIEAGKSEGTPSTLKAIADVLGVTIDDLI